MRTGIHSIINRRAKNILIKYASIWKIKCVEILRNSVIANELLEERMSTLIRCHFVNWSERTKSKVSLNMIQFNAVKIFRGTVSNNIRKAIFFCWQNATRFRAFKARLSLRAEIHYESKQSSDVFFHWKRYLRHRQWVHVIRINPACMLVGWQLS